jgi:hypothetical protein
MILNSSNSKEIHASKIPPKLLYRSNHPVCNDKQVKEIIVSVNTAKIQTVIDLSDSMQSLRTMVIYYSWYKKYSIKKCYSP